MKEYDVFGIGNALVDFLVEVDDVTLEKLGLKKGQLRLFQEKEADELLKKLSLERITIVPGGSAANTIAGVSLLGGKGVFNGKVGKDTHGDLYVSETRRTNVKPNLAIAETGMTGYALTFITPDSERTFAVHLGVAAQLTKPDIFEDDIIKSKILHLEGYLLEDPGTRAAATHAMDIAKRHGTKVSLDLSDAGVVERILPLMKDIVKDHVDIVFANEEEAKSFTGAEGEAALHKLSEVCETAIVKLGVRGSLIKHGGNVTTVTAITTSAVDTTGAGDMYAAGVLYAIANGLGVETGGRLGSLAASLVVSQIGARLQERVKLE